MITIRDALKSLTPSANWSANDDEIVEWYSPSITQPTKNELNAEVTKLQAEYDAQEYSRNREKAYASTGDQLDMQYWDSVNDTTTWKDHIASVKAQFPKV